ncbi:hypothetical protein NADFUDRAFT_68908 [Nadsonia fulvescens var. elongata DSM 6958]|uniref:Amino acid transporter transmembrane domain-containing protein n=1 Tax=Nadsonia fulvescens var. elongata DSM 6958 TaxID=857566 RepID=A0A1E3PNH5_9ASCO|nr:hypothetical protein NADFUDRAFT_68908 [Nadsonia fulvescens var. elongata DSM 6958]
MTSSQGPSMVVPALEEGPLATTGSTALQTIFNSINVLIGVGLLALPLGFKLSGWIIGVLYLSGAALATRYTALILAYCLDTDITLSTYADIGFAAFGPAGQWIIATIFSLELITAGVSLVVLFADSLQALSPELFGTSAHYKLLTLAVFFPSTFLSLVWLSYGSILAILATICLVANVTFYGLTAPSSPGSLLSPMPTTWLPPKGLGAELFLAIGIFMAPWGGHAVFPSIYCDMIHPHKYPYCLSWIFTTTWIMDISMGVVGYLMYGDSVRSEITQNIINRDNSVMLTALVAVIPLTKAPLTTRPLITSLCRFLKLDSTTASTSTTTNTDDQGSWGRLLSQCLVNFAVLGTITLIAILFPHFDLVMALLGASMCVTICLILPVAFYLKLLGTTLSPPIWWANFGLMIVFGLVGGLGTVAVFI